MGRPPIAKRPMTPADLALYLLCKPPHNNRTAFEIWHNNTFAHALENERTLPNK